MRKANCTVPLTIYNPSSNFFTIEEAFLQKDDKNRLKATVSNCVHLTNPTVIFNK